MPTTTTNSDQAIPRVPKTWPGAFGIYKHSKMAVKLNMGTLIGLYLIVIVASTLQNVPKVGGLLSNVATTFITVAMTAVLISSVRGKQVSINDSLSKTPAFFFNLLVLHILTGLALILSLILFVIPFFFVAPRLALADYYLVDKNMNAPDAIKASWAATKGNVSKIWGIIGVFTAMALLCITIIGIPFAIYFIFMYSASMAVAYEYIRKQQTA